MRIAASHGMDCQMVAKILSGGCWILGGDLSHFRGVVVSIVKDKPPQVVNRVLNCETAPLFLWMPFVRAFSLPR